MNGLTTTKRLLNNVTRTRGLAEGALAALILLSALHGTTQGQGGIGAGKVSMQDTHFAASVGVAPGETMRLSVVNALMLDGSVRVVKGHVKVFNGLTGAELGSLEIIDPPAGLHTFDIGGNGRDILIGGAGADRIQLWIEVKLVTRYDTRTEEPGAGVMSPTFELIDNESGRTTVWGGLEKFGSKLIMIQSDGTFGG